MKCKPDVIILTHSIPSASLSGKSEDIGMCNWHTTCDLLLSTDFASRFFRADEYLATSTRDARGSPYEVSVASVRVQPKL
jgi:hypothetical protein